MTVMGGERVDIVVDFSRYRAGSSVVLENTLAGGGERTEVLRFDVVGAAEDPSSVPSRLSALPPVPRADVEREFVLRTYPEMTINDKLYDPARVDVRTTLGSNEIWTVTNADPPSPGPTSMSGTASTPTWSPSGCWIATAGVRAPTTPG